jgi:phosphatidylglycerophosphatase A
MSLKTDEPGKRRFALGVATAFGLGHLPKAPGTFGSLGAVLLAWTAGTQGNFPVLLVGLTVVVSMLGLWAANRASEALGAKDPQTVVVDEVSGQLIAYFGLLFPSITLPNWKYLIAGFILFRAFDIWKPFPARRGEALPAGLGIMADDWIAGLYAALALGVARRLGF